MVFPLLCCPRSSRSGTTSTTITLIPLLFQNKNNNLRSYYFLSPSALSLALYFFFYLPRCWMVGTKLEFAFQGLLFDSAPLIYLGHMCHGGLISDIELIPGDNLIIKEKSLILFWSSIAIKSKLLML